MTEKTEYTTPEELEAIRARLIGKLVRCARCGGSGKINLGVRGIKCPNCLGAGRTAVDMSNDDSPHSGVSADGSSRNYDPAAIDAEARAAWVRGRNAAIAGHATTKGRWPCETFTEWKKLVTLADSDVCPNPKQLRRHLIKRAKTMGWSNFLPPLWCRDGTVATSGSFKF